MVIDASWSELRQLGLANRPRNTTTLMTRMAKKHFFIYIAELGQENGKGKGIIWE